MERCDSEISCGGIYVTEVSVPFLFLYLRLTCALYQDLNRPPLFYEIYITTAIGLPRVPSYSIFLRPSHDSTRPLEDFETGIIELTHFVTDTVSYRLNYVGPFQLSFSCIHLFVSNTTSLLHIT